MHRHPAHIKVLTKARQNGVPVRLRVSVRMLRLRLRLMAHAAAAISA